MELNLSYLINYTGIFNKVKEQLSKEISNSQLIELEFSINIAMLSLKQNSKEKWKGYKLLNSIYLKRSTIDKQIKHNDYIYLIVKVIRHYRKNKKINNERYIANLRKLVDYDLLCFLQPSEYDVLQLDQKTLDNEIKATIKKMEQEPNIIEDFKTIQMKLKEDQKDNERYCVIEKAYLEKMNSFIQGYIDNCSLKDKVKLYPGMIDNSKYVRIKDTWKDPDPNLFSENNEIRTIVENDIQNASYTFIPELLWNNIIKYFKATNEIRIQRSAQIKEIQIEYHRLLTFPTIILSKTLQSDDLLYLLKPRNLVFSQNTTVHQLKDKVKRILNQYIQKPKSFSFKLYLYQKGFEESYETLTKLLLAYKIDVPFALNAEELQYDNQIRELNNYYLIIEEVQSKSKVLIPPLRCITCNKNLKGDVKQCNVCLYVSISYF